MRDGKLGTHCQPDAIVAAPDYAKRLAEESGVDHFILRTGYGLDYPETTGKAVEIIRNTTKAKVAFLVGSWWGGPIKYLPNLPSKSWESKYTMEMPGSSFDAKIIAKYEELCRRFKPDAVCLTHGRHRHPGYIDGLFDDGYWDADYQSRMAAAGIPRHEMMTARAAWEKAMSRTDKAALLKASEDGMIEFLCKLSQSDALKRLVAFRRDTVHASLRAFRKAVTDLGVSFGSNALSPIACTICGQDYDAAYTETCDFVQPLLLYMEWHHYEFLGAWARYVIQHSGVDEATGIEISKRLFLLGDTECPRSLTEFDTCLEGDEKWIYSIISKELKMCAPWLSKPYTLQPVLRGRQWDWAMTDKLIAEAKDLGYKSFIFMGCEYLSKSPTPSDGWF